MVMLGDRRSEIKVVGRTDGAVRPIAVPAGITQTVFYRVVAAFDAAFRVSGQKPSIAEVQKLIPKTSPFAIKQAIASPSFVEAMEARGVGWVAEDGLSPQQAATLNILEDFSDSRKLSSKLKAVGVTRVQFNGWLRDPVFRRMYEDRVEGHLRDAQITALATIMQNAENGDQKAAEKVLEIGGRYNPQAQDLQNARTIVQSLVESVQRHVKDEATIKAIIADVAMAQQMIRLTQ